MNASARRERHELIDALAHPADVTHWRCRGLVDERGRGVLLTWNGAREWSIETLSQDAIRDRWGPGRYVIEFLTVRADGSRERRGRSAPIAFLGPPIATAETFTDPVAYAVYVTRRSDYERAAGDAYVRRVLEHEAMLAKTELERHRLNLAHALERERLAFAERIARIEARSRPVPIEIKLSDLLDLQPPRKAPNPQKPN